MSGFFGCVSQHECVSQVFYGTDYHSHLGTKRAGLAFCNDGVFARSIHSIENAYFRNKFESDLGRFEGSTMGIGVISDLQSQPIVVSSHLGRFAIVTIGRIDNFSELTDEIIGSRINFAELSSSEINPTELIAILITQKDNFVDGIHYAQQRIKGSCSMLILTDKGLYAARDRFGRTPVIIGNDEEGFVAASESSSFTNIGYKYNRDLGPGEIVFITPNEVKQMSAPLDRCQICSFLWVYYGYPSSYYEGINVEDARYRCGEALAAADDLKDIDFVSGIPDSGIGHAIGYINGSRLPYKRAFVKYTPTWPRSFMPQNQKMRDLVARMKLIPNEAFTRGANMILLDDSIVRGTQLKDNVVKLSEAGARGVHIRIACPPLIYPCRFLNFSTSRSSFDLFSRRVIRDLEGTERFTDQMIAEYADHTSQRYKNMVEAMRKTIGVDSLRFQHLDDLIKAIGLPKEKLCTHCWDNSSYDE